MITLRYSGTVESLYVKDGIYFAKFSIIDHLDPVNVVPVEIPLDIHPNIYTELCKAVEFSHNQNDKRVLSAKITLELKVEEVPELLFKESCEIT